MKTKEERNALKNEVEALNRKLAELTEDELTQVTGGFEVSGWNTLPEPDGSDCPKPRDAGTYKIWYPVREEPRS